jgi:hypothetical protein
MIMINDKLGVAFCYDVAVAVDLYNTLIFLLKLNLVFWHG